MARATRLGLAAFAFVAGVAVLAIPAGAGTVDPAVVQARYDAARESEERELRSPRPDARVIRRARATIAWAERIDERPRGWRGGRDVPLLALPRTWTRARGAQVADAQLARALGSLGRSYSGWAGFWVHDLSTGRFAGWNADARFPAASTVKLGVLAAALRRFGPRPERSSVWYDLRQLAGWSSNLAANRVVRTVGGERVVEDALHRLGARSSTYPGPYRAGTVATVDVPKPPAHGYIRVTTARDLGRALATIHAAAAGRGPAQRRSGLTGHAARRALALLVDSSRAGENAGLVAPAWRGVAIAQKTAWLSDMRGTVAVVYEGRGPMIVVVLVYRPSLTVREARALGRRVVELVRRR